MPLAVLVAVAEASAPIALSMKSGIVLPPTVKSPTLPLTARAEAVTYVAVKDAVPDTVMFVKAAVAAVTLSAMMSAVET